jgi:hypothetical protein
VTRPYGGGVTAGGALSLGLDPCWSNVGAHGDDDDDHEAHGDDATPLLRRQLHSSALRVVGRTPMDKAPPEVLLYIPGFNASLRDGVMICGQLLGLADFPPSLKAFMFSWPGGRELTYFTAINYSHSARNQADFAAFVASIIDAGVREIHVLAHSVGAHVLFSALHLIMPMLQSVEQQQRARRPGGDHEGGSMPTARLATVMVMSPDYPLKRFIHSDFNKLRQLCSNITLYCDISDRALTYSEIFNREKALGKNPYSIVKRAAKSSAAASDRDDRVRPPHYTGDGDGGHSPNSRTSFGGGSERQGVLSWVASLGEYMGESVPAMFRQSDYSLDADLTSRHAVNGLPLDMDVIDTSWMDTNIHGLRHNYFNVNRFMIDDIRDIISTKRRAHLRSGRLTHRRGNVWSFLGAPKYIVNA